MKKRRKGRRKMFTQTKLTFDQTFSPIKSLPSVKPLAKQGIRTRRKNLKNRSGEKNEKIRKNKKNRKNGKGEKKENGQKYFFVPTEIWCKVLEIALKKPHRYPTMWSCVSRSWNDVIKMIVSDARQACGAGPKRQFIIECCSLCCQISAAAHAGHAKVMRWLVSLSLELMERFPQSIHNHQKRNRFSCRPISRVEAGVVAGGCLPKMMKEALRLRSMYKSITKGLQCFFPFSLFFLFFFY